MVVEKEKGHKGGLHDVCTVGTSWVEAMPKSEEIKPIALTKAYRKIWNFQLE